MKDIIKKVPLPLCGVMLGVAALGNLLQSYSEGMRSICGIVAAALLILILLKLIMFPKDILEDMQNPIMASVAGTFPMSLMLLSVYAKPFIGPIAYHVWIFAIALHVLLIIYFTIKFMAKLKMPKVFASYYIVYVGIAVASITAPAYDKLGIGSTVFKFAFICLLALLILVTVRYIKYKEVPEPAKPLFCIYAAPVSLCIAGYIQSVTPKHYGFLITMFILATILYSISLIKLTSYLKLPFYPSYAAFTFPFVISAIASKQTMACLENMGKPMLLLQYVVLIETIIAVTLVIYVLNKFLQSIFGKIQISSKIFQIQTNFWGK